MVTRRLLRIKAIQTLYAHAQPSGKDLHATEKELHYSIQKSHELYHYLLQLLTEISFYADERAKLSRQKHLPNPEDHNPSTRFIDNEVIRYFVNNQNLQLFIEKNKLSWIDHTPLVRKLYEELISSIEYKEYMSAESTSLKDHKSILIHIVTNIIPQSEDLAHLLEEKSIYWNDDLDFALMAIIKTIKSYNLTNSATTPLQPLYNFEEDKHFATLLFRKASRNMPMLKEIIQNFTKNWDVERIAYMDIVILILALTEIMEFPTIPKKVTFNEYIEIAKYYSTNKSSNFINGVLDKVVEYLQNENKIVKEGRGLKNQ